MDAIIPVETVGTLSDSKSLAVAKNYNSEYPRYKYCQHVLCPTHMELRQHVDMTYQFGLYFCSGDCANLFYQVNKESLDEYDQQKTVHKFVDK